MMDNFKFFYKEVLQSEGGWSDDPDDRGGKTNYGITAETFRTYINDVEDRDYACGLEEAEERLRDITFADVHDIYEMYYWDVVRADELPSGVDVLVADWAVNSGPAQAIMNLQELVSAKPDGIIGPKTMEKVFAMDPPRLAFELYIKRLRSYRAIASLYNNKKFLKGWNNRATRLYNAVLTEFFI